MAEPRPVTAPPPLRVGVWIQAVPDVDLRGEGIARTLAAVLRSLASRPDTRLTVALAGWSEAGFRALLDDWRIPQSAVTFIVSRRKPPLVVRLRRRESSRPSLARRIQNAVRRMTGAPQFHRLIGRVAGITSWPLGLLLAALLLVAGIAILPVILVAGLGIWAIRRSKRPLPHRIGRALAWAGIPPNRIRDWFGDVLLDNEFRILAERARRAAVDVWFLPYPGATHGERLDKPLVVAVPDLLYLDFPTLYPAEWSTRVDRRALSLLTKAAATISYSEEVAARHVIEHTGIDRRRVHVIPHAPFDTVTDLDAASLPTDRDRRATAARLIRSFFEERMQSPAGRQRFGYHRGIAFDEVAFLFVASQVRASKNYLNLFRAYRTLVREGYLQVKLVVTGDIGKDPALREYLRSERLDLDILSVPNLPSRVHAAFMHLAALTVVPTLFEGGFPFPFCESLSVDTPVLMSDIPVTRASIPDALAPLMLFDPYDVGAITERLIWGLDHREQLLAQQQPFYGTLRARSWDQVANEYRAVFSGVVNQAGR